MTPQKSGQTTKPMKIDKTAIVVMTGPINSHCCNFHAASLLRTDVSDKAQRQQNFSYLSWRDIYLNKLFFAFSAQKPHVKPQNHLNPIPATTSTWRISSVPFAILDI
jgi:hypothetical protein